MIQFRQDIEDTARLVLMEKPDVRFLVFALTLRDELPFELKISDIQIIYSKYRGWDGRIAPTHSIDTGEPLRRLKG